jgi:large subunit ribosomal protein L18
MSTIKTKQEKIARRHKRIRTMISGTAERPRLSVFRSNKGIYTQIINDEKSHTLAEAHSADATTAGIELAKKAKALKITKVVFDRGGYLYAGKIKAVADAARKGGLIF